MVRKLVAAAVVMTVAIGFAYAAGTIEYGAGITGVTEKDGKFTVSVQKVKKGKADGDEFKLEVTKDCKVAKGNLDKDTKKWSAGDEVKGGLKADAFAKASKENPVAVRITADADNKTVSQILLTKGKK
jgi:hypothetical protein